MAEPERGPIRIGVGGWTFPPWRGVFYPEGLAQSRELEFAAQALTSIEINGTYYGSQKPSSFLKWHEETPEGFVFSLKGPRFATNRRVLAEGAGSVEKFFESGVAGLGEKLGPVNWQFAKTKRFDAEDFESFLGLLPKEVDGVPIRHAVEVRHESFADPAFVDLLRRYGVAVVTALDSEFPEIADITADFVYVRIMGTSADEAEGYDAAGLDRLAGILRDYAAGRVPAGPRVVAGPAEAGPREVFGYVIAGAKERNPAAAQALIARLS